MNQIRDPIMWELFSPLGATTTLYQSKAFLDSETRLNLHDHGLPQNAVILDVNYTAMGMFCREAAGNSRRQRLTGDRLQFSGFRTCTHPDGPAECDVNIAVTWVKSSDSDFAWNNLVKAFDAYADNDYEGTVVPANVAVENRLFILLAGELTPACSKERIKDFLGTAATYSYQLNVLLPYVAAQHGLSRMDNVLRGRLNRLRGARNEIAHAGHPDSGLKKGDYAEMLAAAVFGFRYLNLCIAQLRKKPSVEPASQNS